QIVMNLVGNARDAMPDGGQLIIRTELVEVDLAHARREPQARLGQYLCLSVSDTGIGMDGETLGHVFEPVFTTEDVGQGNGLGLATVYGIVAQHGGWVEVQSVLGRGSVFRLYLPGCEEPAERAGERDASAVRGGDETILVVEDEAPVRQIITHA